jgi:hypothetical protein
MPLCFRICHCVAPTPFLAAALLFLALKAVGSVGPALAALAASCREGVVGAGCWVLP